MVQVEGLTKKYGPVEAVSDLSFAVSDGEICGFLGPNGAGKSTTLNILTGCLAPTSGKVTIGGFDIFKEPKKAKSLLGYLPEHPPVYPSVTPEEYLRFVAEAKGINKKDIGGEIKRVIEAVAMNDMAKRLAGNLSKGYQHRLGLAQALLGNPRLIVLDEPTVGLDPKQIAETRRIIKSLKGEHTVIVSSHILSEISALCDKVLIIDKGRLLACDSPENLKKLMKGSCVVKAVIDGTDALPLGRITAITGTKTSDISVADEGGNVSLAISATPERAQEVSRAIFDVCASEKRPIISLNTVNSSLEDVFLELTK